MLAVIMLHLLSVERQFYPINLLLKNNTHPGAEDTDPTVILSRLFKTTQKHKA